MRRRLLRRRLAERVLVALSDSTSVAGWLEEVGRDGLLLRAAELHTEGEDRPVKLSGEVFLPDSKILFVQLLGSSS